MNSKSYTRVEEPDLIKMTFWDHISSRSDSRPKPEKSDRTKVVEEIARVCNVSVQCVYNWVRKRNLPSQENQIIIAEYFGVLPEELFP